jgi:murein DD-endopeptidase MepM/ murein hydrolase activator NlpD
MRNLRTSWVVVVTRGRVVKMPLSRVLFCILGLVLAGMFAGGNTVARWRDDYRARLQDLAWLRQHSAAKTDLVREQHRALSAVVAELAELREEAMRLQSMKDQVRTLGHLEGEHDLSLQLARTTPLETPADSSATVMLGYAYEDLDLLRNVTRETNDTLALLIALLEDRTGIRPDIPTLWPVSGKRSISSGFGQRRSPWSRRVQHHRGVDIRGPFGEDILAAASGRVTYASRDPGYGNLVVINHGSGIYTWYGHLSRINVEKGAQVKRGQGIGKLGSTGRATGPHLHFEVRVNGVPVDPERYFVN